MAIEHPGAAAAETAVVAEISRDGPLRAGSFGLTLAEAKDLLTVTPFRAS